MIRRRLCVLALCIPWLQASAGWAADWATGVINYSPGLTYPSPDPNDFSFVPPTGAVDVALAGTPSSALLNGLTADTGFGALTPFNAVFSSSQYVGIGQGGSLTLQFPSAVRTNGFTIGVHAGVGLVDTNYPNGSPGPVVTPYTTQRRATVEVSTDDSHWVSLGTMNFDNPSNYFATGITTPGFQSASTGGTAADVQEPFLGNLNSFSGLDWDAMLTALNGSAGGNWLDLSATGLQNVDFIRFTVPTGSSFYLDGVVGLPVPEPATLSVFAVGAICLMSRRKR